MPNVISLQRKPFIQEIFEKVQWRNKYTRNEVFCNELLGDYILVESEPPVRMSLIDMFPISSRIIDGPASLRTASDKVVFTAMHLQI